MVNRAYMVHIGSICIGCGIYEVGLLIICN